MMTTTTMMMMVMMMMMVVVVMMTMMVIMMMVMMTMMMVMMIMMMMMTMMMMVVMMMMMIMVMMVMAIETSYRLQCLERASCCACLQTTSMSDWNSLLTGKKNLLRSSKSQNKRSGKRSHRVKDVSCCWGGFGGSRGSASFCQTIRGRSRG